MPFEKCIPVLLRYYHPNTKLVPDLYNRIQHCLPSFKADFSCSSSPTLAHSQYVYAIVVHFIYNLLNFTICVHRPHIPTRNLDLFSWMY